MKRTILIAAGSFSLLLGIIGAFLPVLPSTPLLLLSAACYVRSSRKLYLWLTEHRILGNYIRSYMEYKAISPRAKILAIAFLWGTMVLTILFFTSTLWMRVILFLIAVAVTIYLVRMKTLTAGMIEEMERRKG